MLEDIATLSAIHPEDISPLIRRRAEIREEIARGRRTLRQLAVEFQHVDAAIRELKGNEPMERMTAPALAISSDMTRILFEALDAAETPMTSQALASRVMEELGLDAHDRTVVKHTVKRVCVCLWEQVQRGYFRQTQPSVRPLKWERVRTAQ